MNDWWPVLAAGVAMVFLFAAAWAWCVRLNNYSPVDAFWAFGIGICAAFFAVVGEAELSKRLLAGALALAWSLRLGWHLQKRIRRHHPSEDTRYQKLREVWEGRVKTAFFWFFQAQALSVILLSLPFFVICSGSGGWGPWESVGLAVTLLGLGGESLADRQMDQFKTSNNDPQAVCREGLWKYSRHPNYFFEFVIWVGFFLVACGSPGGWLMLYAPATILFLLLKVTGIPPTEASAVLRKGQAYRDYQATTSAFFPMPPKSFTHD